MPRKSQQQSGGARLVSSGRKPVLIGLTPDQWETIRRAGEIDGRPTLTQFLIYHGLRAAAKILEKSGQKA